ncbi:hypothetical protein M569_01034 [Genlisea aurea]|uniref:BAG domain-containing protein n=1 Tax=Genlisea aurea TaxID=192259 RepID=S8D1S4_9LAMI|nr:hypothetical protein M569_01034 [Genlisea aurea]
MMQMKTSSFAHAPPPMNGNSSGENEWELRPGGMLVQKRTDGDKSPPKIRVRVKYGDTYHEIHISSQATFGALKKKLSEPTGLNHHDQKLFFKNKEKDSKAFLDISGVKDKSKLVLQEDPISKEKRYIEMKKNSQIEKALNLVSQITSEVDKLEKQVSALESVVSRGGKVVENDVAKMIDLLMNQLLKLDAVSADGDVKLLRKMQARRVQKCIETLDSFKLKQKTEAPKQPPLKQSSSAAAPVVITTQWETFDSAPNDLMDAPSSSTTATGVAHHGFTTWDLL